MTLPKSQQPRYKRKRQSPNKKIQFLAAKKARHKPTDENSLPSSSCRKDRRKSNSKSIQCQVRKNAGVIKNLQSKIQDLEAELFTSQTEAKAAKKTIKSLSLLNAQKDADLEALRTDYSNVQEDQDSNYRRYRSEYRKNLQYKSTITHLRAQLRDTEDALHELQAKQPDLQRQILAGAAALADVRERLKSSNEKMRNLHVHLKRTEDIKRRAIDQAVAQTRRKLHRYSLKERGYYKPQVLAMVRFLYNAGCPQTGIGRIIKNIGWMFGINVKESISRRSVQRAIRQGGVAAEMQLGWEIEYTNSLTISSDGTTHRHLNYESRHVAFARPEYDPSKSSHVVRLVGVNSSVDHTSETQIQGWKDRVGRVSETYTDSPLAKRNQASLTPDQFVVKVKGMNSDHAEDQKKVFKLLGSWKADATMMGLGGHALLLMTWEQLCPVLDTAIKKKISDIGGQDKWDLLSSEEKLEKDTEMMQELCSQIGTTILPTLPESVQDSLKSLIWAGCAMHKELNSVKGGDKAMQAAWAQLGLTRPVLLANKDNTAVLEAGQVETVEEAKTEAEKRVFDISGRGGVKTVSLAGAILNHKDDKKGQHETYRVYMEQKLGKLIKTFPDTSNTRFQSFCEGAAHLLLHLELHLDFLDSIVRLKKENSQFNNMEANLFKALQDEATLTEMAVLALYAEAVSIPYMRAVRGPGTEQINALDLGPLHVEVKEHIKKLIDSPSLLLTGDPTTGSLDGQPWENPGVISAALDGPKIGGVSKKLPHLEAILVAFLKGSLITWERFTMEFAPGGLIDLASASEREAAWMPSTNDANEGALGSYRLYARSNPGASVELYNANAMYRRNHTEEFMLAKFDDEDYKYLRVKARILDQSGLEKTRRKEQAEFDQRVSALKRKKEEDKKKKDEEKKRHLEEVESRLVLDPDSPLIEKMKKPQLVEQLECLRQWDKLIPNKTYLQTKMSNKDRKDELKDALRRLRDQETSAGSISGSTPSIIAPSASKNITSFDEYDSDAELYH